jgi:CheY-like chemotaxis protein
MRVSCPHCGKQLKISEKIHTSLDALGVGQQIRVKCVQCEKPFGIDSASVERSAAAGGAPRPVSAGRRPSAVRPPDPPDISWLKDGVYEEKEAVEEIPRALVLMPDVPGRATVVSDLEKLGYRVELAASPEEGMNKMQFVNYAAVILHSRFEGNDLDIGSFHRFLRGLSMSRRRYIFYVLIGEEFKTLYDLQALATSANLVVNDDDIPHFSLLLRKSIPEYEALFGPLMEELRLAGR